MSARRLLLAQGRPAYAAWIAEAWHAAVDAIFRTGNLLIDAKARLDHGDFTAMLEEDLPFGARTAQRLMAIAGDRRLQEVRPQLPPSWRTLYELTRLDDESLAAHLAAGDITPELDRRDVTWWTLTANRQQRHRRIAAGAVAQDTTIGPFPLIYADPPWRFDTYSEKGQGDRSALQHYPTLTDGAIADFEVAGQRVAELAADNAALFLWCTSSNLRRAVAVMDAWGFEYKTHAVWRKDKVGLGLVFRNQHEILLYGICGNMPAPQFRPDSVFDYPRGRHSAKPPQIRETLELMYPDFDARTRLELFSRGSAPGWTSRGYEATT